MRAWLVVCAALALAPPAHHHRLQHIKTQILAKLGLSERPTPLGAPPRDVVRQILARTSEPEPHHHHEEQSMREIIAIAHRDSKTLFQLEEGVMRYVTYMRYKLKIPRRDAADRNTKTL